MKKAMIIFPAVGVLLVGLYLQLPAGEPDGGVAYPFSHKQHVVEEELECMDCHAAAQTSESGLDNLFPAKTICLDCHDEDEISDPAQLLPVDSYSEKFSHAQHMAAGENCQSCHSDIIQQEAALAYVLPNMLDCMSCHENKAVAISCESCHLPGENLLPVSHWTRNFIHNHSDLARMDARVVSANMECATCHKQNFCQDCHEGENLDRTSHPLNFEFTHALQAQLKANECATCHTERQFCIDCHRDNNVLPRNHTVGWVNNFPNDGGRHRVEALNDLNACMACHEQNAQQICETCHGQ